MAGFEAVDAEVVVIVCSDIAGLVSISAIVAEVDVEEHCYEKGSSSELSAGVSSVHTSTFWACPIDQ